MRVFIAEKPELAKAIVSALGGGHRQSGYFKCGSDCVTWCVGHMLVLCDPEDYDPQDKRWSIERLPIVPIPWKRKVLSDREHQLKIIKHLLSQASEVIHAGDPDEEGQLLVDNVLTYFKCRLPVKRLLINDNNLKVVKKSLKNLKNNIEFKGLSARAEARSVADQLYGYNLTRLYTVAAQQKGYPMLLSVGRVQTPILGLVVRRDRLHEQHKKNMFYVIKGQFVFKDHPEIEATYQSQAQDPIDDKKRVFDLEFARKIADIILNEKAYIKDWVGYDRQQSPTLPYNLLKLQTDASRKFQLKPDEVLKITQRLRENHQLITYNRSDCQYLSDEHHPEASDVLFAISKTAPMLFKACGKADPKIKSKAFDSKKVSAHHAIIPTQKIAHLNRLSDSEQKIYLLIARAYVAQFFPAHCYEERQLTIICGTHPSTNHPLHFKVSNRLTQHLGWGVLYKNDSGNEEWKSNYGPDLNCFKKGLTGVCQKGWYLTHETKALAYYTVHALLKDLTCISKYAENNKIKQLLKEKDKGKLGEAGGIGTPATRSSIIKQLFDRKFLIEKGRSVISTPLGRQFYDLLPAQATTPDMTALWHEQQKAIELGDLTVNAFIENLVGYLNQEINRIKKDGLSIEAQGQVCEICKKGVWVKRSGVKGCFMGCSRYPACLATKNNVEVPSLPPIR